MSTKQKSSEKVIKQNVGIDVSKSDLSVCLSQQLYDGKVVRRRVKASRTFNNTLAGFKKLVSWIEKKVDKSVGVHVTFEPTGVYHENLFYYLKDHSAYVLHLIVGSQSKKYAESLGLKSKTDKVDAKTLSQLGLERDLRESTGMNSNMRRIKQLGRERVHLLEQKTALSNRLHALTHSYEANKAEIKRLKRHMRHLAKLILEVEKEMKEELAADTDLQSRVENIVEIKGLGWKTVLNVIAELNGFEEFSSRGQVVSYCGYDVVERQSGSSINGKTRISKKGNHYVRRALHLPALSALKYEPKFTQLYQRVLDASGIKMKAVVAVQRKLLVMIYTLYTKNEKYDREFEAKKAKENEANLAVAVS